VVLSTLTVLVPWATKAACLFARAFSMAWKSGPASAGQAALSVKAPMMEISSFFMMFSYG